jgi:hypothetical protein
MLWEGQNTICKRNKMRALPALIPNKINITLTEMSDIRFLLFFLKPETVML